MTAVLPFVVATGAVGAVGAAALDYAYAKHLAQSEAERHQTFLKANPPVKKPGNVLATFPEDPEDTPAAWKARNRRTTALMVGVPLATILAGMLIEKFSPQGDGWTVGHGVLAGRGLSIAGVGALALNLYLVAGGLIPGVGVKR